MYNLILVDFSWIYNKYYFVARQNVGDKGTERVTEEVTRMLGQFFSHMLKGYPKAKVILALDSPTSSLKNSILFEGYKQNRDKEGKKEVYKYFTEVVKTLSLSLSDKFTFVRAISFEADQVISYFAHKYEKANTVIFSGDKDLLQLTYLDNVEISDKFNKGKFIVKSDEEIFEKFKNSKGEDFTRISTNKRDILKYRTLKGDPSDNLSPVFPRIKDKEIVSIIRDYWADQETLSEERINDIIDDIRGDNSPLANKLSESAHVWLRNYKIMSLYNTEGIKVKKVKANG